MARQAITRRSTNSKRNIDSVEKEYNHAISLMQYHTQILWQQFGTFMLAETVIIGFLGNSLSKDNYNYYLILAGAILGLIICIPWLSTFSHNYEYYRLRMAQARQNEATLGLNLLTQGQYLSKGTLVEIDNVKFQHSLLARFLPPRIAMKMLIFLFGLVFITFLVYAVQRIR